MAKSNKDVDKLVRKGIEFGFGVASITVKALNKALDELEKEGHMDKKDSERLVLETVKRYEKEGDAYAKSVKAEMDRLSKSVPDLTKKEMKELNKKIDSITKMLNKRNKRAA
ncbi:MAG: hypothetical protein M1569_00175 [Candidatus Marsarchaeota archaeon]|nr:hypothetical protein [Candidatus Marsarchaeota archaeon]